MEVAWNPHGNPTEASRGKKYCLKTVPSESYVNIVVPCKSHEMHGTPMKALPMSHGSRMGFQWEQLYCRASSMGFS